MNFLKVFDAYSLRARMIPALLAVTPLLAALLFLISWKSFEIPNSAATFAVLVLLFAIADFARSRGRAIERKLYAKRGGMPSIRLFRRNDSTIDSASKERYRIFLASKLGSAVPTAEVEQTDQTTADSFYEQCGVWLRQNTRDTKKFHLLFNENMTYGFRRNLFGLKWLALAFSIAVISICFLLLWRGNSSWGTAFTQRTIVVLVITAIHTVYILIAVREKAVWDAATAYARELILSCEVFLGASSSPKGNTAPRQRATAKRGSARGSKESNEE